MAVSAEQAETYKNTSPAPILVFTWGNPSRGDDAIGPEIYNRLADKLPANTEILTDFQLQIEHVTDLQGRDKVIFVDASVSAEPPFEYQRIHAIQDNSYTTHAMSPQALLAVYKRVTGETAPESYLLSIRGYEFGLGADISTKARRNLESALDIIEKETRNYETDN